MNHRRFVLGVDVGTGSARAFLFDERGRRRGGVRLRYHWRLGTDGAAEVDADGVVELICDAIDGALAHLPAGARVVGVGFSALWHTLLATDTEGNALTPVIGWNDTRATGAARELRTRLDERAIHQRTGALLHPSFPPARLAWLRQELPDIFAQAARWMSLPEYFWLRLTRRHVTDISVAAGSGLLDRHRRQWDEELCAAVGVRPAQLGQICSGAGATMSGEQVACTSGHAHGRHWPQLRDAMWRLPVGDGACACIGSGCTDATRTALSIGTSAALRVVLPHEVPTLPDGLWSYRLDETNTLLGGAISNGGLVRNWLLGMLRLPKDPVELDTLLTARTPAAHGLDMLPFLAGERSPEWPLDATAAIAGLRAATSPLDMLQAGLEAVAYRLELVRRLLRTAIAAPSVIVASGGGVRQSPYWAQLLADVFGEPVHLTTDAETSSRGAALLALQAAGVVTDLHAVAQIPTAPVEPHTEHHRLHAAALDRHLELARRLT